ncbi:MAG: GNAT family N-acetyltransferase [Gammaproteobacteria bacterium]|nr:GNAT family N-acetyltransferase [Gammaproteobacteria bacterium]
MKIPNSERLAFRLMDASDADELYELDQDPEVMRYVTKGEITTREKLNEIMLPRMASYRDEQKGLGIWRVATIDDNEFLGWVLARPMNFFNENRNDRDIELGWRFKRICWGKGYATEAAMQVMTALQHTLDLDAFSAIAEPENLASINIMKKLGMSYVKTDWIKDPLGDFHVAIYRRELSAD